MMLSPVSPLCNLSAAARPGDMSNTAPSPGGTTMPWLSVMGSSPVLDFVAGHLSRAAARRRGFLRPISRTGLSVGDVGDGAQLLGRGMAIAKKVEIGRNLLEQHIGADQGAAAMPGGGLEERRHPRAKHDIADQGTRRQAIGIEGERIAFGHAERRRVDHEIEGGEAAAGGIVVAEPDIEAGIVL